MLPQKRLATREAHVLYCTQRETLRNHVSHMWAYLIEEHRDVWRSRG